MARKVFISVLGFSNYSECIYTYNDYKSHNVKFIQEATLEYLMQKEKWQQNDVAYILFTREAEIANWLDNGHKNRITNEPIPCEGLCSRLNKMNIPISINAVSNLPHGNSEDEIWEIFNRVYSLLNDGDELYFDLTHGFRYLPMLILVLTNYSKFLKNTIVKSVTYGNFESRNSLNEAPIIDLLPLAALQDWTYAAGQYIDSGNPQSLINISNRKIQPILKETKGQHIDAQALKKFTKLLQAMVEDFQTCRGINIINSTNIGDLINVCNSFNSSFISPLSPLFFKIKESLEPFDKNKNTSNGIAAALWCVNNGLYQQAITILQESIVSKICELEDLEFNNPLSRSLVNKAFNIYFKSTNEEHWIFDSTLSTHEIEEQKSIIKRLVINPTLQKLATPFATSTELRNDINHAGMRANPCAATRIKANITAITNEVVKIINNQ